MTCFKKFGYPIYFTMVMAIMAASIATYYYKIIILSSALMIIGIITLIFLSLVIVYTFSNISANPVDLMAVISGILATIIRIKLFIPSLFYSSLLDVLLVIISMFWFIVLYLIIKNSSEDIYFKHHLIGVSAVLLSISINPIGFFNFLKITFLDLGIIAYIIVSAISIKNLLKKKIIIDETIWIQMGLPALICSALIDINNYFFAMFFYIFAVIFLPFVIVMSIIKISSATISLNEISSRKSLWSSVFPQAIFSEASFLILKYVNIFLLYYLGLIFSISAVILWFAFSLIAIIK